jgi:hypothetical protein
MSMRPFDELQIVEDDAVVPLQSAVLDSILQIHGQLSGRDAITGEFRRVGRKTRHRDVAEIKVDFRKRTRTEGIDRSSNGGSTEFVDTRVEFQSGAGIRGR